MKRLFSLLFVLPLLAVPKQSEAQFFKKLFGGDNDRHHTKPRPRPVQKPVNNPPAKPKDNFKSKKPTTFDYAHTTMRSNYRIDVLIPLYLSELVKDNKVTYKNGLPEKAQSGISFYQGVRLAADTLNKQGYHIDIYVHDVTNPAETPDRLISNDSFANTDLIIGAVTGAQIAPLAAFAKQRQINFISAFSPSDGNVKDNPYFTLLQASLQTHCERIRIKVAQGQGRGKVLIYHRSSNTTDDFAWKVLCRDEGARFTTVNCDALPLKEQLFLLLDSSETNTVIIPIIDQAYAGQIINQLKTEFPAYHFEIYGMPSWKGAAVLKAQDSISDMSFVITEPFYFDLTTATGQSLLNSYHKAFGNKPSESVFRGYETIYWYAYLLDKYGTVFNTSMSDNAAAAFTAFDIKPKVNEAGELLYNENQHIYFLHYHNGNMQIEE